MPSSPAAVRVFLLGFLREFLKEFHLGFLILKIPSFFPRIPPEGPPPVFPDFFPGFHTPGVLFGIPSWILLGLPSVIPLGVPSRFLLDFSLYSSRDSSLNFLRELSRTSFRMPLWEFLKEFLYGCFVHRVIRPHVVYSFFSGTGTCLVALLLQ